MVGGGGYNLAGGGWWHSLAYPIMLYIFGNIREKGIKISHNSRDSICSRFSF